jgi:hypothetical protein
VAPDEVVQLIAPTRHREHQRIGVRVDVAAFVQNNVHVDPADVRGVEDLDGRQPRGTSRHVSSGRE